MCNKNITTEIIDWFIFVTVQSAVNRWEHYSTNACVRACVRVCVCVCVFIFFVKVSVYAIQYLYLPIPIKLQFSVVVQVSPTRTLSVQIFNLAFNEPLPHMHALSSHLLDAHFALSSHAPFNDTTEMRESTTVTQLQLFEWLFHSNAFLSIRCAYKGSIICIDREEQTLSLTVTLTVNNIKKWNTEEK